MSGHSKWSTIKHKKGVADARRGQLFTKLSREITIAAKEGGGDPDMNFRLRLAMDNAKSHNMPKENIERAIAKGAGTGGAGDTLVEITYEAYGPGGAGILIQTLTDNKNRTASDVRAKVTRGGGVLAGTGAVSYNFATKGLITVKVNGHNPDDIALAIVDAGAEDVNIEEGVVEVTASYEGFESLRAAISGMDGIEIESAELAKVPNTMMPLDEAKALQTLRLLDTLEELDDVQRVFSNADFPEAILEQYSEAS